MAFINTAGMGFWDVSDVKKAHDEVFPNLNKGVNNVISTGSNVVSNVIDTAGDVIKIGEFTLLLPLIAVGLGLFFFLKNQSPNTLSNVASAGAGAARVAL
jgi:hypothetical protein